MKRIILAATLVAGLAANAHADTFDKPCTSEPKEKWMSIQAIEKIVTDHGYTVTKARMKGTCTEIYAKDAKGTKTEFFIDPATGNPVGADWKAPASQ
jgi:hypothetical protein